MAKLKTVVNNIIDSPHRFNYDLFEENTGIGKEDNVTTEEAVLAFHEAEESLEQCNTRANREQENKGVSGSTAVYVAIFSMAALSIALNANNNL